MKQFFLILVGSLLVFSYTTVMAESTTEASSTTRATTDAQYAEQKKADQQKRSTEMRKRYYDELVSKGYDVSLLTSEILDGTITDEAKFWEVLKQVRNNYEIKGRREFVAKLSLNGYDVSLFTDDIIADSARFWELVKKVQSSARVEKEPGKTQTEIKTHSGTVNTHTEIRKEEKKKPTPEDETAQKVNPKNIKMTALERAKKLFIDRLDKIPDDKIDVMLPRLESNLKVQIEIARKRNNTILIVKLEMMLKVVQERMTEGDEDEYIINSLFAE